MDRTLAFIPPAIDPAREGLGLIGFVRAMVNNPVSAIPAAVYRDPVTALTVAGTTVGFVCDPEILEEILIRRVADFPKSEIDDRVLRPAFGDSLLTAHGDEWKWKRRLAAPYFSPAALAQYVPVMIAPFQSLTETWRSRNWRETVAIEKSMTSATLEAISRTLFSDGREIDSEVLSEAIDDYLAPISWVICLASLRVPAWMPYPGRRGLRRGRKHMREVVGEVVRKRRHSTEERHDICADLMRGRDPETDQLLSDEDVIDLLLTLVAAGHETSANGLTWALYCLASQPEIEATLADEVARVVGNRPVEATDLPALVLTEAFVCETMRLFPPAPLLARRTTRREELGGLSFAADTTLYIPIYAIHRHHTLWSDPDLFRLERFSNGKSANVPRTAYMPFGTGPRICIGGTFAMMEMVAALATMLQSVRFDLAADTHCEPIQRVTLRPKGGLRLHVRSLNSI